MRFALFALLILAVPNGAALDAEVQIIRPVVELTLAEEQLIMSLVPVEVARPYIAAINALPAADDYEPIIERLLAAVGDLVPTCGGFVYTGMPREDHVVITYKPSVSKLLYAGLGFEVTGLGVDLAGGSDEKAQAGFGYWWFVYDPTEGACSA